MANWTGPDLLKQTIQDHLAKKISQAIWNVQVQAWPTHAKITWVQMLDALSSVRIFLDDGWRVEWGTPYAGSGHYSATFTDLPQNTEILIDIIATDPRPRAEQVPGGDVIYRSIIHTTSRDAVVRFRSLKEVQGEGEIKFITRLYDYSDYEGGPALSAPVQYGRAHMDPDGSPIGDPFGDPLLVGFAPDAIAIYTWAGIHEPDFIPLPGRGIGDYGELVPDTFPKDAPAHGSGSDFWGFTGGFMTAQTIVTLPDQTGPYEIRFSMFSGVWDYAFTIEGTVSGQVSPFYYWKDDALMWKPRNLAATAAVISSPRAVVAAGNALLEFRLGADGCVYRRSERSRRAAEFEMIGSLDSRRLIAAGRSDGEVDLISLRHNGDSFYARAGKQGRVSWQDLGQRLTLEPATARAPNGDLHLFGVDPGGTLVHTTLSGSPERPAQWNHWGEAFVGRVSCACDGKGRGYLFARKNGNLVCTQIALGAGDIAAPAWEPVEAPFEGPVLISAIDDGPIVVVGVDSQQVLWMRTWNGHAWTPDGPNWERMGTFGEFFGGSKERPTKAEG